ncbi:MAG TPA: SagB/ThcOx family dehydrogenase [Methanotrichaceae archaeon]|nr:SagB/ThcOx family dehydrogenase [Methanotrichaceae archaeon]
MAMTVMAASGQGTASNQSGSSEIKLNLPQTDSGMLLDKALLERRTIRTLKGDSLSLDEVSHLLWAAQGITDDKGHRTAGSAWDAYPLEVYVISGNVTNISAGVYHYLPKNNSLVQISAGDVRGGFVNSSVVKENGWISGAPVIFVMAAVFERAKDRVMNDSPTIIELGMASQNLLLEVTSMGLGSTYVAGFNSTAAREFLGLQNGTEPIGLMPVGKVA